MAEESFTEITSLSWGRRIIGSLKAILFGGLLIILAIGVLWWNEGRAVKRSQALDEGAGQVVSVTADRIDDANEGKLVHLTGRATTQQTLVDPQFNIRAQAIKLYRDVQMYQWQEREDSETREKLGGGTETVTTYSYAKGWEDRRINSTGFKQPDGHQNPDHMPYGEWRTHATDVTLGAFRLSSGLIDEIDKSTPVALDQDAGIRLPTPNSQLNGNEIYVGANPHSPQIGDIRIQFKAVYPTDVSVVSMQRGESFAPYVASNGNQIELLEYGNLTSQEMFQAAQDRNTYLTWGIRVGGFILVFIGLRMLLAIVPILAAVIPAIGALVDFATGLLSFLLAGAVTLITTASAWIFYRPLLGTALLIVAALLMVGLKWVRKNKLVPPPQPAMQGMATASPPPPPA